MGACCFYRLLLLGVFVALGGCAGYQLGNIPSSAMSGVKTVYVPVARNLTMEPGLPVMVTNAVIRRLENDGTYSTARTGSADAELTVTLTHYERVPIRRSRADVAITTQYRAVLTATVTLVNRVTGATVLKDRLITGTTEYLVQGDAVEAERQAMPLAAQDLATRIVAAVAEGW